MYHSSLHQGVRSTTVTASHMTQGRVEYESTIPQGTDEGLDLWEALIIYIVFILFIMFLLRLDEKVKVICVISNCI
jgi:hypothetical protein